MLAVAVAPMCSTNSSTSSSDLNEAAPLQRPSGHTASLSHGQPPATEMLLLQLEQQQQQQNHTTQHTVLQLLLLPLCSKEQATHCCLPYPTTAAASCRLLQHRAARAQGGLQAATAKIITIPSPLPYWCRVTKATATAACVSINTQAQDPGSCCCCWVKGPIGLTQLTPLAAAAAAAAAALAGVSATTVAAA